MDECYVCNSTPHRIVALALILVMVISLAPAASAQPVTDTGFVRVRYLVSC